MNSKWIFIRVVIVMAMLLVSACSENLTLSTNSNGQSELKMTKPQFLSLRAINADNLQLDVRVNNAPVTMEQNGGVWTGTTMVPVNSAVTLEVEWSELVANQLLRLARAQQTVNNINSNISFTVDENSYVTNGVDFDADQDTISNIEERRQETDPFDANSPGSGGGIPGDVEPMVKVPASMRANVIDGNYNTAFWNNSQLQDVNGNTLLINNLIVDENASQVDGQPNYQWAAIHDEEFLTLFVFGKAANSTQTNLHGDSGTFFFQDDTLELYFDGDLSQLSDYDNVDDMQIIIPLLRGVPSAGLVGNQSGETDTRIKRGANVSDDVLFDVDTVEFATCLCFGERVTWEIRINLAAAGIPVGRTFGFEIQINEDDDGDERDAKWAWALPSRGPTDTSTESDLTWRFPNTMGTMRLLPFP